MVFLDRLKVQASISNVTSVAMASTSGVSICDGQEHSVLLTRKGANLSIHADGVAQAVKVGPNTLQASDMIALTVPLAIAALNVGVARVAFCPASFSEFAVFTRELSANEAALLAAGLSPLSLSPLPDHYWRMLGSNNEELGGWSWTNDGTTDVHPTMYETPSPISAGATPVSAAQHEVFVKPGSPADPATDIPAVIAPAGVDHVNLYGGSYPSDSQIYASIWARNIQGRAASGTAFSFPTDGSGVPSFAPPPVRRLRARPLSGGRIEVSWEYRQDTGSIAQADHFLVTPAIIDPVGGSVPAPVQVTHVPPRERYNTVIQMLTDGLHSFTVVSLSAGGESVTAVQAVEALADSVGPAVPDLVLSVSE